MQTVFPKFNTLRNQMLVGFLLIMVLILGGVAWVTFDSVSTLLTNNAEKNIQQTAVQANGRLEGILQQIDTLSTQVATNPYVQQLLLNEANGKKTSFAENQMLASVLNIIPIYGDGVISVELYSYKGRRLFPLDGKNLQEKISGDWIIETMRNEGSMVWFDIDPKDRNSILAIRLVKLVDQSFAPGGYLLVRLQRNLIDFEDGGEEQNKMVLVDQSGNLIASNTPQIGPSETAEIANLSQNTVKIDAQTYMVVRQRSEITGWTLLILTPIGEITKGISVLRSAIVIPAAIGSFLFVVLSLLLSTVITKPILKLIKTMRGARFGVLKPVPPISSTIEIVELNRSYNEMVGNINDLIRLVYEKEILQSRTELKALQAQVNPHFLFNTLEALYRSLCEKNETELAEFVITMSDLFRYTITKPNRDEWVALSEEIAHVEKYLQIMKMRLKGRLSWDIDMDAGLGPHKIPKLLIQPIVENAIVHGIENKIGPGKVSVSVSLADQEDTLAIRIADNGAGMDEATLRRIHASMDNGDVPSVKGSGMGLASVQRRIRLYYAHASRSGAIRIRSRKGEGTLVEILIPYQ